MNTDKLMKMLSMETAAGDWFSKLSRKEQEAYKRAHPRSKFARSGGRVGPSAEGGNPLGTKSRSAAAGSAISNYLSTKHGAQLSHMNWPSEKIRRESRKVDHWMPSENAKGLEQDLKTNGWRRGAKSTWHSPTGHSLRVAPSEFKRGHHSVSLFRGSTSQEYDDAAHSLKEEQGERSRKSAADGNKVPYDDAQHMVRHRFPGHIIDDNEIVHGDNTVATIHPSRKGNGHVAIRDSKTGVVQHYKVNATPRFRNGSKNM